LDSDRFDLFRDLLHKAIEHTLDRRAMESAPAPHLATDELWNTIQTGNMTAIKDAARYYRKLHDHRCRFTIEQLSYIASINNPELWEIVARHKCKPMPSCAPVNWLVVTYSHLLKQSTICIESLTDQFCDDHDRTLAIVSGIEHLLQEEMIMRIIAHCYDRKMYCSMSVIAHYLGLDSDRLVYYLLTTRFKTFTETWPLNLADRNCYLLQFSQLWSPSLQKGIRRHTRNHAVCYHDGFAVSQHRLTFTGSLREEPEGPRSKIHNLGLCGDPSRFDLVVVPDAKTRVTERFLDDPGSSRHKYTLGDIIEIPMNGWYIYRFTTFRMQDNRCIYAIAADDDPDDYLTDQMRAIVNKRPSQKTASRSDRK